MTILDKIVINIGKGHIVVNRSALAVYLYKCYGKVKWAQEAMTAAKNGQGLPDMLTRNLKLHRDRVHFVQSINLCAAEHMGKTGKCMCTRATAGNWKVA